MRRKILLCALLLIAPQAFAAYSFDGANDTMTGTFTSTYGDPITIGAWVKTTDHPAAIDVLVTLGNANDSVNNTYNLRTTATDNSWSCASIASGGGTSAATNTTNIDNTWTPILCVVSSDSARNVYVAGNSSSNSGTDAVSDGIQHIRVGESFAATQDFTGKLAHVTVWNVALDSTQRSSFLGGTCPSSIGTPIAYYDLQSDNSTQANAGSDASGDLSVTGATYDGADNPSVSCTPSFSAAPSCSATTNGVSCTYTASVTSTLYGVGVNPGDGTPTCTQIKAGQNDGGSAALWTGSDSNTGTSDTITVTGSGKPVRMDLHFCLNNGGGDSSVDSSQTNKDRSPRSGFAVVALTSVSTTSQCDQDGDYDPDIAPDDVLEYEVESTPGGYPVTVGADCDLEVDAAGDTARQTIAISQQDVTSATTGCFTTPSVGCFSTDDKWIWNNTAPVCPVLEGPIVWDEDEAIATYTIDATDDDAGDVLTYSSTGDSLPAGLSLNTSTGQITGTPTTEDTSGAALEFTVTDEAGANCTVEVTSFVVNTWTVPNCVGSNLGECADLVAAAAPWRADDPDVSATSFACDALTATGDVVSQSPTAASEASALAAIGVVIDRACAKRPLRLNLGW